MYDGTVLRIRPPWLLAALTSTCLAVATAGCDEGAVPVVLQNDGPVPIVISRGPARSQTQVAPGDVGTYAFSDATSRLWIDGGTADSGLTITLSKRTTEPIVVVATDGTMALPDPAPFRNGFLEKVALFASGEDLKNVDPARVRTTVAGLAAAFAKRLRFSNQTSRVVRIAATGEHGLLTSVDFEPGQQGELPYAIILSDTRILRVDISDPGANRGYRVYFTRGYSGSLEFMLPSEPLPTATVVPLDPRLCTLAPAGCASPTPNRP